MKFIKLNTIVHFILLISLNAQPDFYNQEFQINTKTQGYQTLPKVTTLLNDDFVVCWESATGEDGVKGNFGQIIAKNGIKKGDEFQITNHGSKPSISGLKNNGFLVCWTSKLDNNTNDWDIIGQIFKDDGKKIGNQFTINTYTDDSQYAPEVCDLIDGGFVICWESEGQDGDGKGIFGQIFESNGTKRGSEFQINSYTKGDQYTPRICKLYNNSFVVCWYSWNQDMDTFYVFGQIFNSNGKKINNEFSIRLNTDRWSNYNTCGLVGGGFVFCTDDGKGISLEIFDDDGKSRENEFIVNLYTQSVYDWSPCVSEIPDGGFVVCWSTGFDNGRNVFAQLYNNDITRRGKEFLVNTYVNLLQGGPKASASSQGDFLVCWISDGQDGDNYGVFGKIFSDIPKLHDLKTFMLYSPINETILNSANVFFDWQQASSLPINLPWELEYNLYLDTSDNFNDPEIYYNIFKDTFLVDLATSDQVYYWKILAKNIQGDSLWSSETFNFYLSPITYIEEEYKEIDIKFALFENYPNPFNLSTRISYFLQKPANIEIKIYNILGEEIIVLLNNWQQRGVKDIVWNGYDSSGTPVGSGTYIYEIRSGEYVRSGKMHLIK